jgi:hypothetical protein
MSEPHRSWASEPAFACLMHARAALQALVESVSRPVVQVDTLTAIDGALASLRTAAADVTSEEERRAATCTICGVLLAPPVAPHGTGRRRRRARKAEPLLPEGVAPITGDRTGLRETRWCQCPECGVVYRYEYDYDAFMQTATESETLMQLGHFASAVADIVAYWLEMRASRAPSEASHWRDLALRRLEFLGRVREGQVVPPIS